MQNYQYVLGIETSCDETAVAIYSASEGLKSHTLLSQIIHRAYGGVVPELASRDHIRNIMPLLTQSLSVAKLDLDQICGVGYCSGPGLKGALLVGATFGRSLGWALNIPTLGIHHMEAHLLAVRLEASYPEFPFLALLVSGGHTLLVSVQGFGSYQILGESLDDAVGEAFDKVAKLLGLGYPGGSALEKLASSGRPDRFKFPNPMHTKSGFDFSFSGLKTHTADLIRSLKHLDLQARADIACGFQSTCINSLITKTRLALAHTQCKHLVVAGGVASNRFLRAQFQTLPNVTVYFPRPNFCTDNAAMIAYLGYLRLSKGQRDTDLNIRVQVRWPLKELSFPN